MQNKASEETALKMIAEAAREGTLNDRHVLAAKGAGCDEDQIFEAIRPQIHERALRSLS